MDVERQAPELVPASAAQNAVVAATPRRTGGQAARTRRWLRQAGNQAALQLLNADLHLGRADDPAEREARAIAAQVAPGANDRQSSGRPAVPAGGRARAAVHHLTGLEGRGAPLPEQARRVLEAYFGRDLARVRLHTDSRAGRAARALGAQALAIGPHIVFAPGRYDPAGPNGRRLLAHEVAHTLQQREMRVIQRDPDDGNVVVFTGSGNPLEAYTVLEEAISADDWTALNNAARLREEQAATQTSIATQPDQRYLTELEVPLSALLRPRPDEAGSGGDWQDTIYDQALEQLNASGRVNSARLSRIIQGELLRQWTDLYPEAADQMVRVALIDPDGEIPGPSALTFQFNDNPIQTSDGALYLSLVDRAGPGLLPGIEEELSSQLQELAGAIEIAYGVPKAIEDTRGAMARGHRELAAQSLDARLAELQALQARASEAGGRASGQAEALQSFITDEFEPFVEEHAQFETEHAPPPSMGETLLESAEWQEQQAEQLLTEGGVWSTFLASQLYQNSAETRVNYAVVNAVAGQSPEESRQLHEAFREGRISLATLEEASDAVFWRGALHVGLMAALTIASMGLAGAILGTGAGLGSQVLYWGTTSALTTALTMTTTTLYSASREFEDPLAQAIWARGERTPGEIALASAISFGIGGAIPVVSWIGRGANTQTALAMAEASAAGRPIPAAAGVEVTQVGRGVIAIRVPGQPGVMEVTREGWRAVIRAGTRETTVASGTWADEVTRPLTAAEGVYTGQFQIYESPFAVGVHPRGWAVLSPGSAQQLQVGLWEDLLLAGGRTGLGRTTPLPMLLPATGETVTAQPFLAGALPLESRLLMGGAETAVTRPPAWTIVSARTAEESLLLPVREGPLASRGAATAGEGAIVLRPPTAIAQLGDPGWERVPGHAMVRSRTTGEVRRQWQWVEDQATRYLRAGPGETQVRVGLPTPEQFPGRGEPQTTIILDNRLASGSTYAETKARNWGYTSNVEDLIGSVQRMIRASQIESATLPAAAQARFTVITTRTVPVEVHNTVSRRLMEWLTRDQGMSREQAIEVLERITYVHLRPTAPP